MSKKMTPADWINIQRCREHPDCWSWMHMSTEAVANDVHLCPPDCQCWRHAVLAMREG